MFEDFIQFADPRGVIGFPIVREGTRQRWLTGGDIDPESVQRDRHGDTGLFLFDPDGVVANMLPPYPREVAHALAGVERQLKR